MGWGASKLGGETGGTYIELHEEQTNEFRVITGSWYKNGTFFGKYGWMGCRNVPFAVCGIQISLPFRNAVHSVYTWVVFRESTV